MYEYHVNRQNSQKIQKKLVSIQNFPLEQLSRVTFIESIKDEERKAKLKQQMQISNEQFVKKIKLSAQPEKDFMRMFKMQLQITDQDLNNLDLKYRVRFFCFFFCNFVDKIFTLYYFKDFWVDIKIYQSYFTVQTKYSLSNLNFYKC